MDNKVAFVGYGNRHSHITFSHPLKEAGFEIDHIPTAQEALGKLEETCFSIVVLNSVFPDGKKGSEALKEMRNLCPHSKYIIATRNVTLGSSIDAIKSGAADYIGLPIEKDYAQKVIEDSFKKTESMEEIE